MDTVRSKRLTLIPFEVEVAEAVLADRPKAESLLGATLHPDWPGPDTREFLPYYIHRLRNDPGFLGWGVWLMVRQKVSGPGPDRVIIGDLGFKGRPDRGGVVDIGYAVVPSERGTGYASEASRALTDWAFGHAAVKMVTADCEESNPASAGVLTEIGMKRSGRKQRLLHWKMTRRDWERTRPGGPGAKPPRMYHVEQGSGFPVVMVHGLACSSTQWMYTAPALARAGYRAVSVDLPGFGESALPKGELTTPDYAREMVRFLDEMGIDEAFLVGNSMGGFVAWYTAAVAPERVRAVILVDPAGAPPVAGHTGQGFDAHVERANAYSPGPPPFSRGMWRRFFTSRPFRFLVSQRALNPLTRYFMRAVASITFGDPTRMSREVFEVLHQSAKQARILFAGRLRWQPPLGEAASLLEQIKCPSLTVWGSEDKIIPVASLDFFRTHLRGGKSAMFQGAGHVPMLEVPEEFNAEVLKFLDSSIPPSR